MRRCLLTILLLSFNFGGTPIMSGELDLTQDVVSFNVGGIPVILRDTGIPNDVSEEIVAIEITAFGGVSLSDKPGVLGMMTSVIPKGTYSFSKEQIDDTLTRTGADFSLSPSNESVTMSVKALRRFLPELLPMMSEMLRVPKFDPAEIELVRKQLTLALRSERDHPDSLLALRMHEIFFAGHPYINRPSGHLDTVASITREDLSSALFRTFNTSNLLITIVGNLRREEAAEMIQKYFGSLQSGGRARDIREAPQNDTAKIHFSKLEAPTTYFMARFRAPSLESPDYPALTIGMQILRDRLFEEVRTKRALTYAVRASLGNSKVNSGVLYVTSTRLPEAVDVMFQEVKKLQVAAVDKATIETQINKYLSGWLLGRETRSAQASIFSAYEVLGIGWENSDSFMGRLRRVTPGNVQEVMQKYLRDFSFVTVGPEEPPIAPILTGLGYFSPQP